MFNDFSQGRLCISLTSAMQHSVGGFNKTLIYIPFILGKRDRVIINVYDLAFPSDRVNSGMETLMYSCLVKALHAKSGRWVLELDCEILNENHGFLC